MRELLAQFVAAIEAEIALIEKDNRDQTFELLSGQRDEHSTGSLYVFLLADPMRLPEDAFGTIQANGHDYGALIVAQEGNRIWVLVESAEELPQYFASARLILNQTDLLRRLKEKIEELSAGGDYGLAPAVFGLSPLFTSYARLADHISERIGDASQAALQQAIGSNVTYLWGPPGTGKTFTIAALVASLAEQGESVLVTSHTHAAVEQALWALIEPPSDGREPGLLYDSELIDEGRILKVGPVKTSKIPASVQLDGYIESQAKERNADVAALQAEIEEVSSHVPETERMLSACLALEELEKKYEREYQQFNSSNEQYSEELAAVQAAEAELAESESLRTQAESSFFIGRGGRVAKAQHVVAEADDRLQDAKARAGKAHAVAIKRRAAAVELYERLADAQAVTADLPPRDGLEATLRETANHVATLEGEIEALRAGVDEDARSLVRDALGIFATLTKLYMDRNLLPGMTWDTVVIDEASMAMLPLVAYAAAQARTRVVIVGDMYQLPPIVQST
jgi:hypothetical protein